MGKALRDVELPFVFIREDLAELLAESGGTGTEVHCHIKHTALYRPHQLALGMLFLEVKTTEYPPLELKDWLSCTNVILSPASAKSRWL